MKLKLEFPYFEGMSESYQMQNNISEEAIKGLEDKIVVA